MKRAGFTMIELIFVIVILGILASVAIPKLAGVQDDALEASERAAIASARTGIQSLRGKRTIRGAAEIPVSLISSQGRSFSVRFVALASDTATTPSSFSPQGYPWGLSVAVDPATVTGEQQAVQAALGTQMPLVIALELDNPGQWLTTADNNYTRIKGPASSTIAAGSDAQINLNSHWRYDAGNGQILLDANGTTLQVN